MEKKYRFIHMNKFYFNLQSAFLFVGGTRDVIFKIKSRSRHQGHGERKKMHMLHGQKCNGVHFFFIFGLGHLICSSVP